MSEDPWGTYRVKIVKRPKLFGAQKFHVVIQDAGNNEVLFTSEKLEDANARSLAQETAHDLGAPPPVWEERP